MMRKVLTALAIFAGGMLSACSPYTVTTSIPAPPATATAQEQREPVTILISIDGFRADYLGRGLTPTLSSLANEGVTAAMRPSFPSKTFPNHWAEVTGYVPDKNGITANSFIDPSRDNEKFTMSTNDPFYWNEHEPIWVTAENSGIRTATMFWPGSSVAWGGALIPGGYGRVKGGIRPQDWTAFDQNVSPTQRVNTVIDWLRRPTNIRPEFVLLYFDEVDTAGHEGGPDSEVLNTALRNVDADIAMLLSGLKTLRQPANIIITADHGMAETRNSRTVELNQLIPPDQYILVEAGPYASFNPLPGKEKILEYALLRDHEHMECWRKSEIPDRFHYGTNPRIPAYLCLADMGWQIYPERRGDERIGGNHGYDPYTPEMAALFIAHGPTFNTAKALPPFPNVSVNPLLRRILDLPLDNAMDGSLADVESALRVEE